jgi:hypothetical protein
MSWASRSFELCLLIEHARAYHGRLEAIRLRDRSFGHFAAIRPASDSQPISVGVSARDQCIQHRHQILVVAGSHGILRRQNRNAFFSIQGTYGI